MILLIIVNNAKL